MGRNAVAPLDEAIFETLVVEKVLLEEAPISRDMQWDGKIRAEELTDHAGTGDAVGRRHYGRFANIAIDGDLRPSDRRRHAGGAILRYGGLQGVCNRAVNILGLGPRCDIGFPSECGVTAQRGDMLQSITSPVHRDREVAQELASGRLETGPLQARSEELPGFV